MTVSEQSGDGDVIGIVLVLGSLHKRRIMIRKVGSKYVLYSHDGKKLGTFSSRKAAEDRERQVKYFKHKKGK